MTTQRKRTSALRVAALLLVLLAAVASVSAKGASSEVHAHSSGSATAGTGRDGKARAETDSETYVVAKGENVRARATGNAKAKADDGWSSEAEAESAAEAEVEIEDGEIEKAYADKTLVARGPRARATGSADARAYAKIWKKREGDAGGENEWGEDPTPPPAGDPEDDCEQRISEWESFAADCGFTRELIVPYQHFMIGAMERAWGINEPCAAALLANAHELSAAHWYSAFEHAFLLFPRRPECVLWEEFLNEE